MPMVSIYLSDDLYARARARSLPIAALAQEAIESALRRGSNDEWVERMRNRPPLATREFDMSDLMDEVKGEWPT